MNEIHLYGTVGDSFWDEEYFTASSVREKMVGLSGPLKVRLNSPGGLVSEGQAIYTMLKDYDGEVEIVVDGVAMSSASLIAMAGDKITMRLGSYMLIHDPARLFGEGRGTADDHREWAAYLDKIGDAFAEVYAVRSGKAADECRAIMRAETVYLGREAVEAGFATSFEGETQAAPAAAFDYRMYATAPEHLRAASERLGEQPSQSALAAMIAGAPRKRKEPLMADPKKTAAEAPAVETKTPEVEAKAEAPKVEAAQKPEAKPEVATMSARQLQSLYRLGERANMTATETGELIEASASFDRAVEALTDKWKEQGDMDIPMHGRPTARVLRDEREVRREGMTGALVAQIKGDAPGEGPAREYMDMSLAEMAAASCDYRGSMRSAGDRLDVFMAASHSTSDFPAIFENALNKVLLERYQVQAPTYREISRRRDFTDFRPHPMVRAGDFPKMQPLAEGGEIKFGTIGENKETAVLTPYAVALTITRQMLVNDDLGAIDQILSDYGSMVADFEEETFFNFFANATLADGNAVWLANASRGSNLAGTAAAITVSSLALGRAAMRKQTTIDGKKMNLTPSILLVGPDKETEADQIVTTITPQTAGNVNPFSGRLRVVTTAQITGNNWYLFAEPSRPGGACFVHGFLNGAAAPRVRMDEPFGRQGMSMSVEHDFGLGAIDFRGTYKNAGA